MNPKIFSEVDDLTPSPVHLTLDQARVGQPYHVRAVTTPAHAGDWAQTLEEIGFVAGEPVMLMTRGVPGGDPLAVRVGGSTFALRRAEAACVHIDALRPDAAS